MTMVTSLESNLYDSFDRVKSDVLKINSDITRISAAMSSTVKERQDILAKISSLSTEQRKVVAAIGLLSRKVSGIESMMRNFESRMRIVEAENSLFGRKSSSRSPKKKTSTSVVKKSLRVPRSAKLFVASRKGTTFFPADSVQAKNIKPVNRVVFKSRKAMLKRGYKPSRLYIKRV